MFLPGGVSEKREGHGPPDRTVTLNRCARGLRPPNVDPVVSTDKRDSLRVHVLTDVPSERHSNIEI